MRRALAAAASIVFLVAWMSPAVACACLPGGEGAHVHSLAGPERAEEAHASHAAPEPPHGAECHEASGAVPHESPTEPICCEQGHDAPAAIATLPDTQKSSSKVLLPRATVEIVALPASSPVKAEFRWREPPLAPFATTRRPLLI